MYFKIRIEYGVCVLIFSWVLALYSAIYGISAQKEVQQLQQSLDLAQSLVIFGAIKNRRIYVFHEEPLMDEDYIVVEEPNCDSFLPLILYSGPCNKMETKTNIDRDL